MCLQRFWADAPSPRPGWGPRIVFGCRRCRLGAPGVFAVLETLKLVALPCPPDVLTHRTPPSPQPFSSDPVPPLSSHRGPRPSPHRLPGPPCRAFAGYRPGSRCGRQGAAARRGPGRRRAERPEPAEPSPRVRPRAAAAMAERIEQRLEDRVPELEQLERVGLFTRKEIR